MLVFLSTPSARRATDQLTQAATGVHISIHALREEGDPPGPARTTPMSYFYPRPPRGGRQGIAIDAATLTLISIHALREEGDRPAV